MLHRWIVLMVAGACTVTLAGCPNAGSGYRSCTDCNVVVISVDTLRADRVGALGATRPLTPNIDALAGRGALFENAISQSPWTRPAHMSIFTGLHPREHGFVALPDTRRLEDSIPTLASVLRDHGYRTAAFVGGANVAARYGFDRGFDVYRSNGKYFRDNLEDTRHWLDHEATGKFFLFLHGYDAHAPYLTDPIDRQVLELPPAPPLHSISEACHAEDPDTRILPFVREYEGAVHRADRYVGKLVRELEKRGLLENTIVVLLSDHGEEFLEHGRCYHITTVYREVLHVPLLIVAPGLEPHRVHDPVSASVTIAPTVMEMLGIRPHPFPGPSLLAAAAGGPVPADPIVSETERNHERKGEGHVRALSTADRKLIHWTTQGRRAVFDSVNDPGEQTLLEEPARRQELASILEGWTTTHPVRGEPRRKKGVRAGHTRNSGDLSAGDDPEGERELRRHEAELRSLGYVD